MAGMSIAQSGTSIPHSLSYTVTYDLKVPHGKAVGYYLPGFLGAAPEEERNRLLHLAGFSDLNDFCTFLRKVFGDMDISEEERRISFEAVRKNEVKMKSASFYVDDEILNGIVHGYPVS